MNSMKLFFSVATVNALLLAVTMPANNYEKNKGLWQCLQQFSALVLKKAIHSWRNRKITLLQFILPVIFTIWACLTQFSFSSGEGNPRLLLSLSAFTDPVVPYATGVACRDVGNLAKAFETVVLRDGSGSRVRNVSSLNQYSDDGTVVQYLLDRSESDFISYTTSYMMAASLSCWDDGSKTKFVAYFNGEAYHTPAIAVSYVGNTLLQYVKGRNYSIETTVNPLPVVDTNKIDKQLMQSSILGTVLSYNLSFGMSFLLASFVIFLIWERQSKSKHLQYVSGVQTSIFWASTFSWDWLNYMASAVLVIIVLVLFSVEPYLGGQSLGYVCIEFIFCVFCMILMKQFTYTM